MKKIKSFKIRFADDLGSWMTSVKDGEVLVHALGGTLAIRPLEGEDIETLRLRVHELIKGTPAGIDAVKALLELTLI